MDNQVTENSIEVASNNPPSTSNQEIINQVTENSIEDVVVASKKLPITSDENNIESSQDMFVSQQSDKNNAELDENTPLRTVKKAIRQQNYSKKELTKVKDTMNILDSPSKKRNRNNLTPSPVSKVNETPSKKGKTKLNFGENRVHKRSASLLKSAIFVGQLKSQLKFAIFLIFCRRSAIFKIIPVRHFLTLHSFVDYDQI